MSTCTVMYAYICKIIKIINVLLLDDITVVKSPSQLISSIWSNRALSISIYPSPLSFSFSLSSLSLPRFSIFFLLSLTRLDTPSVNRPQATHNQRKCRCGRISPAWHKTTPSPRRVVSLFILPPVDREQTTKRGWERVEGSGLHDPWCAWSTKRFALVLMC